MSGMSVLRVLNESAEILKNADNIRLDLELMLAHVLKINRAKLYANLNRELTCREFTEYSKMLFQRLNSEPMAYILGHKEFMYIDLIVNKDVLIPRPETEILVEEVLKRLNKMSGELKVADIGTGSGAIAVSIAKMNADVKVEAVDISARALEIAKYNAVNNGVADKITFHLGDLMESLKNHKFNAIVSNPPYIPTDIIDTLEPEVKDYEPRLALDGGEDGLNFYRRLICDTPALLTEGGFLAVEIGYDQGKAVKDLMEVSHKFKTVEVIKDLSQLDRVIIARR